MADLAPSALPHIPARVTAGLTVIAIAAGSTVADMHAPPALLDHDGRLAAGSLAILSDSALGYAVMSTMPPTMGMATSHLHLELLRDLEPGMQSFRGTGERRGIQDRFGIGGGMITTDVGTPIAFATIGAVLLERRSSIEGGAASAAVPDPDPGGPRHPLLEGAPVHDLLRTSVHVADGSGVRLSMCASRRLANSGGGVHGGAGVLMGERTLDLALRAAVTDGRRYRPVELRAAFLRPITADDEPVECTATVIHLGRQLASARGEVRDHRGRPAVLVDATYVAAAR